MLSEDSAMKNEFTPGKICVANGRLVEIDGYDSLTHVRARDMADGQIRSYAVTQLTPITRTPSAADSSFVSEAEWRRASALAIFGVPQFARLGAATQCRR